MATKAKGAKISEDQTAPEWEAEPLKERLLSCAHMLYYHDALTRAERELVLGRISKMFSGSNT